MGQEVRRLLEADLAADRYSIQWDGKDALGRVVPSGTYLYRLEAKDYTKTRKMILLR